jgi:hypothetical protein
MAKKFALVSFGVLCLMLSALIGFHVGGQSAQAQSPRSAITASSPSTGIIVGVDWGGYVLDYLGQVWYMRYGCWERRPQADPPVPVSEIKLWSYYTFVTNDDSVWEAHGDIWEECPPWPGGPVQTRPETWGGVKGKYDGNK